MKQTIKLTLISILLLYGFSLYSADETVITYDEYIHFIETQLPQIKSGAYDVVKARTKYNKSKSYTDPQLEAGASFNYDEPVNSSSLVESSSGVSSNAGVSQTISPSGTTVNADVTYDAYDNMADPENYSTYQPAVSVTVRQPIMKNFLGKLDRNSVKSARLQYEIALIEDLIARKSYYYAYAYLYMQWCAYDRIMKLGSQNISNAYSLYQQTLRKKEARIAENDDVQQSYSAYLGYKITQNSNIADHNQIEFNITELISRSSITPDYAAFQSEYEKARDFSYTLIPFDETSEYQLFQKSLDSYTITLESAQNSELPQFDLTASVVKKDISEDAASSVRELDSSGFSVGFEMSYPFGSREAKADREYAHLQLRQLSEELKSDINEYNAEIQYTVDAVAKAKESITLYTMTLRSLRSQLETESKKYSQARITLSNLLETKNKIANAEANLIRTKLELISLYHTYNQLIS